METLPIWRTPEFWRKLAEEWRGPETFVTDEGICGQLVCKLDGLKASSDARGFLEEFRPSRNKAYFFPIGGPFRPHRAELCERIATHLEHEANQAQTSSSQGPTTT